MDASLLLAPWTTSSPTGRSSPDVALKTSSWRSRATATPQRDDRDVHVVYRAWIPEPGGSAPAPHSRAALCDRADCRRALSLVDLLQPCPVPQCHGLLCAQWHCAPVL